MPHSDGAYSPRTHLGGGETFLQDMYTFHLGNGRFESGVYTMRRGGPLLSTRPGRWCGGQPLFKPETPPAHFPKPYVWEATMLEPLSALTRWERWALEAWLDTLAGRLPGDIRWSELPPVRYSRALGQLAAGRGLQLPRRYVRAQSHNASKGSLAKSSSIRATKPWEGR